jgi:integration host factor subunit beta
VGEYRDGRERHGASLLCQASRILWKRLLEQSEKANLGVGSNEPITTWEDVTEDQCFVLDDRLVAGVWLELERVVDPLMKNVQDDIKRGRSEPRSINGIFDSMIGALQDGEGIEIRGFGSFSLHFRPPRIGRNPKTGEAVALSGKYVPHFKPGKDLRERVNDSRHFPIKN